MKRLLPGIALLLLAAAAAADPAAKTSAPAGAAAPDADHAASAPPPAPTGEAKKQLLLRAVDARIAAMDALIGRIPDIQLHASMRALCDGFKDRRAALRAAYSGDTADDLLWDMNVEYQRLVFWLTAPTVTVSAAQETHDADISLDLLQPDAHDPAAVHAALDVIDHNLEQRAARCQSMAPGRACDAEKAKLARIAELRRAMDGAFTPQRWQALITAMRTPSP